MMATLRHALVRSPHVRVDEPMRLGAGHRNFLNVLSAGESAARSALECILRLAPVRGGGCSQHQSVAPRQRSRRRPARLACALLVMSFTASLGIANAATPPISQRNLTTTERIRQLEAATRSNPKAGEQWRQLGAAYVRRAFETADPAFYPLADSALRRADQLLDGSVDVLATKATLALARHRFSDAQSLAAKFVKSRPDAIEGRIALFDAQVELGRYSSAFPLIDELVAQRPNVATLSRLSYRRQLSGDLLGAEIAMRQATSAAPAGSIDQAIALGFLGDVLLESGRLDAASRVYDRSVSIDRANGTAVLGQARVALARGDADAAGAVLDRLIERNPLPGALGLRADIARSVNDTKMATETDQLVDASIALFRSNGAVVDAELAVLLADRGATNAPEAIRAAERAYAERRTIFTNDAMAWSLFVGGRVKQAVPYARAAVAMNPGVSSVRWHAAEVFAEVAVALRNPWSSPRQARSTRSLAARLGVRMKEIPRSTLQVLPPLTTTRPPQGS